MISDVITEQAELYLSRFQEKIAKMPAESVHAIVTDPPYFIDGMGEDWSHVSLRNRQINKSAATARVKSLPSSMRYDPMQGPKLEELIKELSIQALRVLKPGGFFIACSSDRLVGWVSNPIERTGFRIWNITPWLHSGQLRAQSQAYHIGRLHVSDQEKERLLAICGNRTTPQLRPVVELIVAAQKPISEKTFAQNWGKHGTGLCQTWFDGKSQPNLYEYAKPNEKIDHMTVKPIDLMIRIIEIYTAPGQTVFDPFMGSGTTGVAAIRLGRKFIGCEKDKPSFELSRGRICAELKE